MIRTKFALLGLLTVATALPAFALTETFPDPLGGFYTRWLGANSNMGSYYLSSGYSMDLNFRGNNPEGLWISGNQTFGGGVTGDTVTINLSASLGSTLTSFRFGLECFVHSQIQIFDMSSNVLATADFQGGDFGFGHEDIISATSSNGIGGFTITSTPFGGGQISGNTSVDNFEANPVPEPATLMAIAAGLAALRLRRRK